MIKENGLLFEFYRAAMRVRDRRILENTSWSVRKGEHWAVLGPNGSGKSTLVRAIKGDTPVVAGAFRLGPLLASECRIGYVSFEAQRDILARDWTGDSAGFFSGQPDVHETVSGFMGKPDTDLDVVVADFFGLRDLSFRTLRTLSSGELRKVFIAKALAGKPKLLILDEPFEGLDRQSCEKFGEELYALISLDVTVILVTHRQEELFPWITHVLTVQDGAVFALGTREQILSKCKFGAADGPPSATDDREGKSRASERRRITPEKPPDNFKSPQADSLIIGFDRVNVGYDGSQVLHNLSWSVRAGENWCILGPNGSGKTTILNLITRENLLAYANDIRVFGIPIDGEASLWEIRQKIGVVTPQLHMRYRKKISVRDVILSGLFDSTGLYRNCNPIQLRRAKDSAIRFGIGRLFLRTFTQLSFGEQRLAMIARAMVKNPELLILDEPCQGLDPQNRKLVLEGVKAFEAGLTASPCSLLYVTHRQDEIPDNITHILELPSGISRKVS